MTLESVIVELVRRVTVLEKTVADIQRSEGSKGLFARRPYAVQLSSDAFSYQGGHVHFSVSSETGASDDLATIDNLTEGAIIIITAANGHTITVKDAVDNISLETDRLLDGERDKLMLVGHEDTGAWCELSFANNV